MRGLRLCEVSHSRRVVSGACSNHQQRAHYPGQWEPTMTDTVHQDRPQDHSGAGFRRLVLRRFVHRELRLQLGSAAAVHRRRVPPLQLGNPEHSEDHRLHDQAPRRSERGLPHRDGSRTRPEVRQARRAIIRAFAVLRLPGTLASMRRRRFPFSAADAHNRAVSSSGCVAGRISRRIPVRNVFLPRAGIYLLPKTL